MLNTASKIYTPKKNYTDQTKTDFKRKDFIYDQEKDLFVCPSNQLLKLGNIHRDKATVYRVYKAKVSKCKHCPMKEKCLTVSQNSKEIKVSIFQQVVDKHHAEDGSQSYKEALLKRSIWAEGTFAAQKAQHNLGKLLRRGIKAAEDHCLFSACARNLKILASAY